MRMLFKSLVLFFIFLIISGFLNPNDKDIASDDLYPPFLKPFTPWADSVFASLSPDERIAQLFMVAAFSNKGDEHVKEISDLVKTSKIGGLIFFQGGPIRQARLTNKYQEMADVPLMIAMDAEWGLGMRLDSTVRFPYQMTLGAIKDNRLIYEMGEMIAKHSRRLGVHINFAPVVDINNNPNNPVINYRSFGEDRENVASKGAAYMKGMQDNHILANAKHFPGHGDTDTDSHKALPLIEHSKERLDSLELYPFKSLIKRGLGSIMVAHLYIPAYEKRKNIASTLSKNIVTGLLKDSLKFKGLLFTDALNMKGVSQYFKPGIVDVKALLAGNDVLLFSEDVPKAIIEIKNAMRKNQITQAEIDRRCLKILKAKEWLYLNDYQPVNEHNLYNDLNSTDNYLLNRKLMGSALTLIENKNQIIPIKNLDTLTIATLSIGNNNQSISHFQKMVENYASADHYYVNKKPTIEETGNTIKNLSNYNLVLVSLHSNTYNPKRNFGVTKEADSLLSLINTTKKVIFTSFSSPYGLGYLKGLSDMEGVLVSYNNRQISQELSAQLIFGGIAANGRLPITISDTYPFGAGITTEACRIRYTIPEDVGISSIHLDSIDTIANNAIKKGATPGCQVILIKDDAIIYWRAFGHHTYKNNRGVTNADLYDLASITKIAATVTSLMKLTDDKKINIDSTLGTYLPFLDTTDKGGLVIREILSHQARLKPWIPFWLETMEHVKWNKRNKRYDIDQSKYMDGVYDQKSNEEHPIKVTNNLWIGENYKDSIFKQIIASPLEEKSEYLYSDLGYYFLKEIIDSLTGSSLDQYCRNNFYKPLGLKTIGYLPLNKFEKDKIVPTENDYYFRRSLIHGTVHDPGAAMLGGIGGHAGLFSNAHDLGIFMQMLLNGGNYGGHNYIKTETISEFTRCHYCEKNRRAVGFDKPEMDYSKDGPTCQCISEKSFGHTGFTGTLAWADPNKKLVYVFLSNRIHPDATNKKLIMMNVRTAIMETIYLAIEKGNEQNGK